MDRVLKNARDEKEVDSSCFIDKLYDLKIILC